MTDRKNCVITGANAGIGRQAARQIAQKGYHVILACRSRERGESALAEVRKEGGSAELMIVDLSLQESVRSFAAELKGKFAKLDVLIHNAALFNVTQKEQEKTTEGVETVWATNHIGPVLLTDLLMELLKASDNGRVITISSQGLMAKPGLKVDLDDPAFDHRKFNVATAYYQSKRAQVMYTYWLAERLTDTNVTVNCIRVTAVAVDLNRHHDLGKFARWVYRQKSKMSIAPAEMAETYTWMATSPEMNGVNGKYYNEKRKEVRSAPYCYGSENRSDVMELTYSSIEAKRSE
jgi:NAD(P)-dependent dehydrogenase (short-subunit alcohol dehydrogenase family)